MNAPGIPRDSHMSPPKRLRATESRAIAALEGATFHNFRWLMVTYALFLLSRTNVRLWGAVGVLVVRGNVAAKQMARLRTARGLERLAFHHLFAGELSEEAMLVWRAPRLYLTGNRSGIKRKAARA